MELTRLAADAGQFINRAVQVRTLCRLWDVIVMLATCSQVCMGQQSRGVVLLQYTEENLGQADRTELDPGLEELLALADATKTCTDKIVSQTEVLLQPNPGETTACLIIMFGDVFCVYRCPLVYFYPLYFVNRDVGIWTPSCLQSFSF